MTPHFSLREMTVTNTRLRNEPNAQQKERLLNNARRMEEVRGLLGYAIHVHSAFRSEDVNDAVGGAANSDHLKGDATDFTCPEFGSPRAICQAIQKSGIRYDQLILEPTWVHISWGPRMRQEERTKIGKLYPLGIA